MIVKGLARVKLVMPQSVKSCGQDCMGAVDAEGTVRENQAF
jgi:hypothetical protein